MNSYVIFNHNQQNFISKNCHMSFLFLVKYGGNIILIKSNRSPSGSGYIIRVIVKSLQNNKTRIFKRSKRFILAAPKVCKQVRNSIGFPVTVLHAILLESLEHAPAVSHNRLGQPISITWFREKIDDFRCIHINNKFINVKV